MIRLLKHNFWWKATSLALALLVWFLVVGDTQIATAVSVPIQFKDMPPDLEISSEIPDKVELEVDGPSRKVTPQAMADAVCLLDMSTVSRPGERTFTLDGRHIKLPDGVKLARVIPSQLRFRFERRVTRDVPITLRLAGPPPEGLRVASYNIAPQTVRISGPESRVNQLEAAQTDPIDLAQAGADTTEFHPQIFLGNPQVRLASPVAVAVRIRLEKIPGR